MSGPVRQSNLFAAEDFTKIYRSFKDVDFTAYDYDTIRSALVEYIRRQYPEDFNDYIESSEFIAIIEMLSYLGTSLALRTDLNSRENFLDTAERRESVIRLARMLSYNPRRNIPGKGLFKITGVQTNAPLVDSLGRDISQTTVFWNDANNPDSFEQFISILNSAFSSINQFGRPTKSGDIASIPTALYKINSITPRDPVISLSLTIPAGTLPWNIVNPDFTDGEAFYERHPDPDEAFHLIYRNDGLGLDSKDSGFFLFLKQGALINANYQLDYPIKNRVIEVDGRNVNQEDVYFQEIDDDGTVLEEWTRVPAVVGNNVIFNSLELDQRDIYNVITDTNDQIRLKFADGNFGNIPRGLYRLWYRQSVGEFFTISPDDATGLTAKFPYVGKDGQEYVLTVYFELEETISNSVPAETNASIKLNAPAVFYTQNRMVNSEDYNVYPLTRGNEVVKIRAINRTHAGHSRFIALNDPTGITQNVKVFAEDGAIYKEYETERKSVALSAGTNYNNIINDTLFNFIKNTRLVNFFYDQYYTQYLSSGDSTLDFLDYNYFWATRPQRGSGTTGYIYDGSEDYIETWTYRASLSVWSNGIVSTPKEYGIDITGQQDYTIAAVVGVTENDYYVNSNRIIFTPEYQSESIDGDTIEIRYREPVELRLGDAGLISSGAVLYMINPDLPIEEKVVSVLSVDNFGYPQVEELSAKGPIELSTTVIDGWQIKKILPPLRFAFTEDETVSILDQLENKNDFGLAYIIDVASGVYGEWVVIDSSSLDLGQSLDIDNFILETYGTSSDSSWLVYANFIPSADSGSSDQYEFISRGNRYIFESLKEVRFFYSDEQRAIDIQTGREKRDEIALLDKNTKPRILVTETWKVVVGKFEYIDPNGVYHSYDPINDRTMGIPVPFIDPTAYVSITTTHPQYPVLSTDRITDRGLLYIKDISWSELMSITITYNSSHGNLDDNIYWEVDRSYVLDDGYRDHTKTEIRPVDSDEDGIPDFPLAFGMFARDTDIIYFEQYLDYDGYEYYRPWVTGYNTVEIVDESNINWQNGQYNGFDIAATGLFIFNTQGDINAFITDIETLDNYVLQDEVPSSVSVIEKTTRQRDYAQLFEFRYAYCIADDAFYSIPAIVPPDPPSRPALDYNLLRFNVDYKHFSRSGRTVTLDEFSEFDDKLFFMWKHYAPIDNRIDPSVSNIIDMYLLTTSYYNEVLLWKEENKSATEFPQIPTTDDLTRDFGSLNEYKMLSDQIVYQSAKFKVLFGSQADAAYRATFKVVKLESSLLSNSEIKSRVIEAVDEYFSVENWDFGESFFYTELAAYIHQELSSIIASVIIVPEKGESQFGDLFQIKADPNELFISSASVENVEIVRSFTDVNMRLK
jgi:hypothetical protein